MYWWVRGRLSRWWRRFRLWLVERLTRSLVADGAPIRVWMQAPLELPPPDPCVPTRGEVLVTLRHVDSIECWCRPEVFIVCSECGGWDPERHACWRCAGRGEVPFPGGWTDERLHVVHRAVVPGR